VESQVAAGVEGTLAPDSPVSADGRAEGRGSRSIGRERRHPAALRQEETRRRDAVFRRGLIGADVLALAGALLASAYLFAEGRLTLLALATPVVLVVVAKSMGLYDQDEHRLHKTTLQEVPALFAISSFAALLIYLSGDMIIESGAGRMQILSAFGLLFVLAICFRGLARLLARLTTDPERCLLVGDSSRQALLHDALRMSPATHATIVGIVPLGKTGTNGRWTTVPDSLLDELLVNRVVILPGAQGSKDLMFAIRSLRDAGVKVSLLPDITRLVGTSVEFDNVGGVTLLGMRRFSMSRSSRLIKRAFDLAVSTALLTLLSPVLLVTATAIRLDGRGPVIFTQERIGRYGDRFRIHKFRSMRVGADEEREALRHLDEGAPGLFKIANDPRITRVGRFIRRTSIDELPQLLDVLRGTMSLVGPRPLVPEEDEQIVGEYRDRLNVRPGITGHWQILGAARVSLDEMVKLDYLYAANWSLWNDVVLMLRTVPVLVRRRGM
jgi:exopolysaccharide biosynthesis polyprenyl glycosylphosphotransferase